MSKTDYNLKNLLVTLMIDIGIHFEDKETGESSDNEIIKELLKDEEVKDKFYIVLESELIKALEEKYSELKGAF